MTWIILLILLGLMLISFEIIVPGGVLGLFGGSALLGACTLAFMDYGPMGAISVFLISGVLTIIVVLIELRFLPKTKIGARMFLKNKVKEKSTRVLGKPSIIGKTGEALTTLAPTGIITIESNQYEGFSEDGLIEKGSRVIASKRDNFRIVVRKA